MQLLDPTTGELSRVYLFVACLPFSRYAFVEASLDMKQESWLRAHGRHRHLYNEREQTALASA